MDLNLDSTNKQQLQNSQIFLLGSIDIKIVLFQMQYFGLEYYERNENAKGKNNKFILTLRLLRACFAIIAKA